MESPKVDEEFRRKALENLRALHEGFGIPSEEDLRELTEILGDSPDELDMAPVPKGARLRSGSASKRTA